MAHTFEYADDDKFAQTLQHLSTEQLLELQRGANLADTPGPGGVPTQGGEDEDFARAISQMSTEELKALAQSQALAPATGAPSMPDAGGFSWMHDVPKALGQGLFRRPMEVPGYTPYEQAQAYQGEDPLLGQSRAIGEKYLTPAPSETGAQQTATDVARFVGASLEPVPGIGYLKGAALGAAAGAGAGTLKAAGAPEWAADLGGILAAPATLRTLQTIPKVGMGVAKMGTAVAKGLPQAIAHPIETTKDLAIKGLANVATIGSKAQPEIFKKAAAQGVELPVNIGLRSTPLNSLSNWLSNTVFASQKYKDIIQKSNESMLNAVRKNIGTLGKEIDPTAASADYKAFIKEEERRVNQIVGKKYDKARALLDRKETIAPTHTKAVLDKMAEDVLSADYKSSATKKVNSKIVEFARNMGLMPNQLNKYFKSVLGSDFEKAAEDPKFMQALSKAIGKSDIRPGGLPPIGAHRMATTLKELRRDIGKPEDVYGMERWLVSLEKAVEKDLHTVDNPKYLTALKNADKFYSRNYGERFKGNLAQSILTSEPPLYTFNKLKDAHTLELLERSAGNSKKTKPIVEALKKAKVEEIFNKAFTLDGEGINIGNFARQFETKAPNQQFLKGLLGTPQYNNLKDLALVIKEYQKAGQEILNTSKTSYVTSDMERVKKLGIEGTIALTSLFSGNPVVAAGAAGTAALHAGVPYTLSRLLANPKFAKEARQFAMARANAKTATAKKASDNLLERLIKTTKPLLEDIEGDKND